MPNDSQEEGSEKGCRYYLKICAIVVGVAFGVAVLIAATVVFVLWQTGVIWSKSQTEKYDHAAVASASETCSDIGKDIMKDKNGNAVDAAVAVAICLGVVEFQSSGLGGGGFALYYKANDLNILSPIHAIYSVDFRTTAPKHITDKDIMLKKDTNQNNSGLLVATPGELRGLYKLWNDHKSGQVGWADLLQPSIDLAENGFKVSADLEDAVEELNEGDPEDGLFKYLDDPMFSSLCAIVKPNGKLIKKGQTLKRPELAQTLKNMAQSPNAALSIFYENVDLAREVQEQQGIIQLSDFTSYREESPDAKLIPFENGTLYGPELPSSTVIQVFIKNVLEQFSMSSADAKSLLFYHRLVETFKFAFGRRNVLGDPNPSFNSDAAFPELVKSLSRASYARNIRFMIKDRSVQSSRMNYYKGEGVEGWTKYPLPGSGKEKEGGTTHFCVIDKSGNAVSFTTSIGTKFGSKIVSPSTGIIYNNDITAFSYDGSDVSFGLPENDRNTPQPFKRPMSSMSPLVAVDNAGKVILVIGGAGGSRIISSVALAISRHLLLGQSLDAAVNNPRIHHQLSPYCLYYEDKFDESIKNHLVQYEKNALSASCSMEEFDMPSKSSAVHAISKDQISGKLTAVCDGRLSGKPSGY
ncbi:glutathione hydrolase 1 proenzyme-like [Oscarella lobularis]|uniref:glutathione hydrolase 1 proenzyme-like n=1 Tax=Oscarella lobularis TaxID=121494 RepID=UPI0033143D52